MHLAELLPGLLGQLLLGFEYLRLPGQVPVYLPEGLFQIGYLKDPLLFLDVNDPHLAQMVSNEAKDLLRVLYVPDQVRETGLQGHAQLLQFGKLLQGRPHQGLGLELFVLLRLQDLDLGQKIVVVLWKTQDPDPLQTLDFDPGGAAAGLQDDIYLSKDANGIKAVGSHFLGGVLLGHKNSQLVFGHGFVQRDQGLGPADDQGNDKGRE